MVGKVPASPETTLLTAHGHEHQGAFGSLAGRGERLRHLDHGHRARAVVVRAVQIESAPRRVQPSPALGVPMWSMWAVNRTYSFFSAASPPSRIPIAFGARGPSARSH